MQTDIFGNPVTVPEPKPKKEPVMTVQTDAKTDESAKRLAAAEDITKSQNDPQAWLQAMARAQFEIKGLKETIKDLKSQIEFVRRETIETNNRVAALEVKDNV